MGISYNPSIVTNGLVLCLDAGNAKSYPGSGTTWTDLSGRGNNGTLVNGPTYSSSNGGYLSFDGVDDYVSVNISNFFTSYSQQITMESWVYVPTSATWTNGSYGNIFGRGNFDGSHGLVRTTTDNQVGFYCRQIQTVSFAEVQSLGTITRDTWYQLVGVWTGSGTQLYINGVLVDSDSGSLGDTENNVSFEIGRNIAFSGSNGNYFSGNQTGCKIYNKALTASEIQQNFNATRGRFGI